MRIGIVFGTFAPMHIGHLDVIKTAREECDKVVVACCGHEGDRGYPLLTLPIRFDLAKQALERVGINADVIRISDTEPEIKRNWDEVKAWDYWVTKIKLVLTEKGIANYFDDKLIWYTSEQEYADIFDKIGCLYRKLDRKIPISATMIRENFQKYEDYVLYPFNKLMCKNGLMTYFYEDKVLGCNHSIFLAGPVAEDSTYEQSWRKEAVDILVRQGFKGDVYIPEYREGKSRQGHGNSKWERERLDNCSVIMFWIPRDLEKLPGFTTNVEFGRYVSLRPDAVVLGYPEGAPKMEYLKELYEDIGHAWGSYSNHEYVVTHTLEDTVKNALRLLKENGYED